MILGQIEIIVNGTEQSPEIDPHLYSQLIFLANGTRQLNMESLMTTDTWTTGYL